MRSNIALYFLLFISASPLIEATNIQFYSGTINNALLAGNSVFDDVYRQFNSTGILLAGAILLATSGKFIFVQLIHLLIDQ